MRELRIGVVSDIHAQPLQLQRALEILSSLDVDRVVCLGDVVEKGPDPNGAIELIREFRISCVAGNHDSNAVRHAELNHDSELQPESLCWLRSLPERREFLWAGRWILLLHGHDFGAGLPNGVPKSLRKVLRNGAPDVLLVGHTHSPFLVEWNSTLICNPGAVSAAQGRDSNTCGLLRLRRRPNRVEFEVYDLSSV